MELYLWEMTVKWEFVKKTNCCRCSVFADLNAERISICDVIPERFVGRRLSDVLMERIFVLYSVDVNHDATARWSTIVIWWLPHSRPWSVSRRFRLFGRSASMREGECRRLFLMGRMALAKEQQRLHKKTIIARAGHYERVWHVECGAYSSSCGKEDRRCSQSGAVERRTEGSQSGDSSSATNQEPKLIVHLGLMCLLLWNIS